ncbi:hypothetical protein [Sphingobacterium siyangense]|uniref:hypothetical protein n=1 Tax=Sphingobacterium siyangense TaxID=459529 RepID=UPI003DA54415
MLARCLLWLNVNRLWASIKYLDDEWFDVDVMETDDYKYYSTMPKDQIRDEIKSLEQVIY